MTSTISARRAAALKEHDETRAIPVMILTAHELSEADKLGLTGRSWA